MVANHVPGQLGRSIMIYTLSTCIWCKKLKNFLNAMEVDYRYIDMDLLDEPERSTALAELKKWNSSVSYPTIVIDQQECIVGFEEQKIRKALEL